MQNRYVDGNNVHGIIQFSPNESDTYTKCGILVQLIDCLDQESLIVDCPECLKEMGCKND